MCVASLTGGGTKGPRKQRTGGNIELNHILLKPLLSLLYKCRNHKHFAQNNILQKWMEKFLKVVDHKNE